MSETGFKATPDIGSLNISIDVSTDKKVTLDLDDAPFLKEEPKAAPQEQLPEPVAAESPDEEALKKARRKKIIKISISVVALLSCVAAALWFFVLKPKPDATVEPEIIVVPSQKLITKAPEFVVTMEPFWIELPAPKGDGVVFLVCTFGIITPKEVQAQEVRQKLVVLRDAVYYYLKNKSYTFLTDAANASVIKSDLASVINGYLAGGRISGVLFESYLSK